MEQKQLTPWRRFIGLLQLDRKDIRQIFYYAIFAGIVALSLPLGIQAIINFIQGAQVSTSWIILVILVTIGVAFQGVLQLMQIRILENIQQKIFTRSSFEFAYRFPKIKMNELRNFYPPELANRFFDTLTVQKGLSKILIDFPAALLQIIFGLLLLSFYHPFFIIYGILLIALVYVLFKSTARKGLETSLMESKNKYKVAHWIQEVARSLISFKLSGNSQLAMDRNDDLTAKYLSARESHFRILLKQFIQMIGFKVLVTSGLLLIGGLLVLNQQMNIGQFVAAEIIILLLISSVEKVITGLESFYDVLTSLEKIGQIVDKKLEPQGGIDPFENKSSMTLELDDLKYNSPEGQEILKGINFTLSSGDRIHLEGASGAGKTTLLKVISGLVEPTSGDLYINDVSLEAVWPNRYRANVGQVLPDQTPFEGTILENITLGTNNIVQERLHEVLKSVGLLDFIKKQPKGLMTMIHPEGQQIPYTISKRIVLARAIIQNPKLLILKDPLEHFEEKEANRIIDYLLSPKQSWALIISSSNPVWKEKCHRSMKLEKGVLINKNNTDA
ncbi:peptidase domain-containing ABC transporter [Flavivirga algicola]|uniref:ATP-binding cassette domain-containing protein n=1 Tax=Flavivirga algicola TaxID=2729136 RepID=A0ABX1S1D5_9FLAO|nr:ATP-binding cassette domain-containing protein [Flavivirga algicola]NMH88375.1 ATP-binding cassette domain-containing protein [Flavivirga algicola]